MILRFLWHRAWFRAKARDESVLPPPVGTVPELTLRCWGFLSIRWLRTIERIRLTWLSGAAAFFNHETVENRQQVRQFRISTARLGLLGIEKSLGIRKSASTRQEKSIRIRTTKQDSFRGLDDHPAVFGLEVLPVYLPNGFSPAIRRDQGAAPMPPCLTHRFAQSGRPAW